MYNFERMTGGLLRSSQPAPVQTAESLLGLKAVAPKKKAIRKELPTLPNAAELIELSRENGDDLVITRTLLDNYKKELSFKNGRLRASLRFICLLEADNWNLHIDSVAANWGSKPKTIEHTYMEARRVLEQALGMTLVNKGGVIRIAASEDAEQHWAKSQHHARLAVKHAAAAGKAVASVQLTGGTVDPVLASSIDQQLKQLAGGQY